MKRIQKKLDSTGDSYKERNKVKVRVGFLTPYTVEDLRGLTVKDVAERISSFQPGNRFDGPSIEGFADTLGKVIEQEPGQFAEQIDLFKDVPFTYLNSMLYALHKAWRDKIPFEWKPVLEFLNAYIDEKVVNPKTTEDTEITERINPKILAGSIGWLISEGCRDENNSFDVSLLPLVKEILFKLSCLIQHEEKRQITSVDYPTLSYNTTNGKILRALLDYALSDARMVTNEIGAVHWANDIQSIFDSAIDGNIIEGYVFLGMYYEQFYYLDELWIRSKIGLLITLDDERLEAFLGGLAVARIPFNEDVYHWLFPLYQQALEKQKILIDRHYQGGLMLHILAFYFRGYETLTEKSLTGQIAYRGGPAIIKALCSQVWQQEKYLVQYPDEERSTIRRKVFDFWQAVVDRISNPTTEEELEMYQDLLVLAGYIEELNNQTANLLTRTIEKNKKRKYFHSLIDDLMRLHGRGSPNETAYHLSLILSKMPAPDYVMDDDKKKFTTLIRFLYQHGRSETANEICNKVSIAGHHFLHSIYREFNLVN